jgi:putative membrane protein
MTPRGAPTLDDDYSLAASILDSIAGLPVSVAYFGVALLLFAGALALHGAISPQKDFGLLRAGNRAAAVAVGGAMIGLALPLASVLAISGSLLDLVIWGTVALLLQLLAVSVLRRMAPALGSALAQGELASGIFVGALAIAVGILNAAAMIF